MLKAVEDLSNSVYQRMRARIEQLESRIGQASSFIRPEILAIPTAKMDEMLEDPVLAPYKLMLVRTLAVQAAHLEWRTKSGCLAMQSEMAEATQDMFAS